MRGWSITRCAFAACKHAHATLAALTPCAPVAQRLEQQTHNLLVRGSNPCGGTTEQKADGSSRTAGAKRRANATISQKTLPFVLPTNRDKPIIVFAQNYAALLNWGFACTPSEANTRSMRSVEMSWVLQFRIAVTRVCEV